MARPRRQRKPKSRWESMKNAITKAGNAYTTAQKLATVGRIAYRVAGVVNAEKQYYDNNNSGNASTPNQTGNTYSISGIPQGNDEGGRTGNSILLKSIYLTINFGMSGSATQTYIRMLIVEDTSNTGSTPTPSSIMQYNASNFSVVSPLNVDATVRFRVLMDRMIALSSNGRQNYIFRKYMKFHRHVHYTGPNSTDTYKNNIYLVLVSNEPTNVPTIFFNARVGYYDN